MTDSIGRILAVLVLVGGLVWWGMSGDSVDSAQYEEPVEYSPLDEVIGQLNQEKLPGVVKVSAPKIQHLDPGKNKEFQHAMGKMENYVTNTISQVDTHINQAELQRKRLSEAMIRIHLDTANRVKGLPEAIMGTDAESKKYIHYLKSLIPQVNSYLKKVRTCQEKFNGEVKVFQACMNSMRKVQKKIGQMNTEVALYQKRLNAIEDKVWTLHNEVLENGAKTRRKYRSGRRDAK